MHKLASRIAEAKGEALAVFYDNRIGVNNATIFQRGIETERFTEKDALWVQLSEEGEPETNGPYFRTNEVETDAINEYEYFQSPIDMALTRLGIEPSITANTLKQAFCYEK